MTTYDERGGTSRSRLIRLGFGDVDAVEAALVATGLWSDGRPADDGAAEVLAAMGDVTEPDLAAAALRRLVEAADATKLLAALRESEGLRGRLLAVLGASVALGDHLAAHPEEWETLADDGLAAARPTLYGLQRQLLDAVGAPHDPVTGTTGGRAAGTGPDVVASLRIAYRHCLLVLAARDLCGDMAVEDVAGELSDLASATLTAALAVALAGRGPAAPPLPPPGRP